MQNELFHFEDGKESFESYAKENGFTHWSALDLMEMLGYANWTTFNQVISKAMTTCDTLNIPLVGNFDQIERVVDESPVFDFKLSRFACYLISMNGNVNMPQVAKSQAYFATIAGAVQDDQLEAENAERLEVRSEISEREKTLAGVAFTHGMEKTGYGLFQNAGYRGMYNQNIAQLKTRRKIDTRRSLLDFMGKDELAANLFRITQTELKIKNENLKGQSHLEIAAETVGRKVRKTMIEISNLAPEHLEKQQNILDVKKALKNKNKVPKKY